MKKNECAQEMILDLVMRDGCEVKIRPVPAGYQGAIEIVFSKGCYHSARVIDIERMNSVNFPTEEIMCRIIEKTALDLFRRPYRDMMEKHFGEEA